MFRLFSLAAAERGRQKQRLELSLAGICELELLKRRHEALIIRALALHAPEPGPGPESPDDSSPRSPPEASWSLMKLLQHQVGELKMDSGASETLTDAGDARPGPGSSEQTEGPCPDFARPIRLSERPECVADVCVGRELSGSVPWCLSGPYAPLEGEDELWVSDEEPRAEDHRQAQRVETYILGLIQRRPPPARPGKPRTSLGPEPRVTRQSSRREPGSAHYHTHHQHTHSPSSDELVNAQYIPAQPHTHTHAHTLTHSLSNTHTHAPRAEERKPRAAPKKCRFTEEKAGPKKAGRRACRAQSENNLRGASERKYSTAERSAPPRTRRGSGHRRWRSTLELSQDEAEAEQPIRRSRKPRPPPCVDPAGESESSLSEAESPASSSLSSDSDESGGLVWPQQLAPPSPPGHAPKAFVKIKASHALKKKILRFRSGSLKVMTTV